MPNANAQVVLFANTKIRPVCDDLYQVYYKAKSIIQDYNSGSIGSLINAAGAAEILSDGSATDGRTQITGNDIYNVITALSQFVAYVEGTSVSTADRREVITKPHVNGI